MKHTKEPWKVVLTPGGSTGDIKGHIRGTSHLQAAVIEGMLWDDAQRTVACVNALAGIAEPEAFVAKVRGVIAAWNDDEIGQIDGSLIEALEDMLPQENPNG